MKAVFKVLAAMAALLLMAGVLLAAAGWAMGGRTELNFREFQWEWPPFHVGSKAAEDRTDYEDGARGLEALTAVDVDIALGDVVFQVAEDYGVALSWRRGATDYALHYEVDDGVLRAWSTGGNRGGLGPESAEGHVTVYLPADAVLEQVAVDASLGDVRLDGIQAVRADLTLDLGDLTLDNCKFSEADCTVSLGDLNGTGLTVTEGLAVRADLGTVSLAGDLGGQNEIDADLGDVIFRTSLENGSFGYDLSADLGGISVDGETCGAQTERAGGEHWLQISADLGDIEVLFGA